MEVKVYVHKVQQVYPKSYSDFFKGQDYVTVNNTFKAWDSYESERHLNCTHQSGCHNMR